MTVDPENQDFSSDDIDEPREEESLPDHPQQDDGVMSEKDKARLFSILMNRELDQRDSEIAIRHKEIELEENSNRRNHELGMKSIEAQRADNKQDKENQKELQKRASMY